MTVRLVYVYAMYGPDDGRYLYRRPLFLAWLVCRAGSGLDYALYWPKRGE